MFDPGDPLGWTRASGANRRNDRQKVGRRWRSLSLGMPDALRRPAPSEPVVSVGDGIREWAIAEGRNPNGGLSAIPVDLPINGTKRVDATLTIGFPTKGQPGAGELNWDGSPGGSSRT